ncbi:MAG TPA: cupin domain-containing protein [Terriglobales bacterium]|nr:cupin domain-containing protein [Terriglobales bacterium]
MSALQQPFKQPIERKSFANPEESRSFLLGKVDVVTLGGVTFGRAVLDPGWRWSTSVKPIAKTQTCEAPHLQYHVSGTLHVVMDDGTEVEFGPGDVGLIPPGHDAWVVGNEPVVIVDISGMANYARP